MTQQAYTDGVEDISIIGGVVRVDLFAYSNEKPAEEGGRPPREFQQRIVMSPEAFLQAYSAMEQVVGELETRGLVTRGGGGDGGGA